MLIIPPFILRYITCLTRIQVIFWDKISHIFTKILRTCEEDGTHLRISFWHLLMNFEKPDKLDFWNNEKNCWRYHHFTHVYQKPQSYEVWSVRYKVRQDFLSFWAIFFPFNPPPPLKTQKTKILKHFNVIILNLDNKNMITWCMLTQVWRATDIMFCHFRPFFALLLHYWPWKLKFGKNVKQNTPRYYPFTLVYH